MSNISVSVLFSTKIGPKDVGELNNLLREFSPTAKELSIPIARQIAQDDFIFVARTEDGEIVGMTTLIIFRKPTGLVGQVEDVAVAEEYRGKGVGRKLMERAIASAKSQGAKHLQLTSNPRRVAAHALYESLGFTTVDTTNFRLPL